MTKKEALQILAILKAAYPSSYNGMTKEEATGTVAVWCMQFADMPAEIVMMAVHKLISTNKFPPSISEVKNRIQKIHWEAYDIISSANMRDTIPEETRKKFQAIYEATKGYRVAELAEPATLTMMQNAQRLQIGSGE